MAVNIKISQNEQNDAVLLQQAIADGVRIERVAGGALIVSETDPAGLFVAPADGATQVAEKRFRKFCQLRAVHSPEFAAVGVRRSMAEARDLAAATADNAAEADAGTGCIITRWDKRAGRVVIAEIVGEDRAIDETITVPGFRYRALALKAHRAVKSARTDGAREKAREKRDAFADSARAVGYPIEFGDEE